MRALFLGLWLGTAPGTARGLRFIETAHNDTPVTFCRASASSEGRDLSRDLEPGDCRLDGDHEQSMADYLLAGHMDCVRNEGDLTSLSQTEKASAVRQSCGQQTPLAATNANVVRQLFSRPSGLVYRPYVTSLPIFYISRGGKRESCFSAFLENFSPEMQRIEAVILRRDVEKELGKLVEEPEFVVETRKTFNQSTDGTVTWLKTWGCLLAHLKAIRTAYERNLTAAIILEDDAVPLYPSWTSTLEEFLMTLPAGWQAVQLQWSANFTVGIQFKRGRDRRYEKGSGWGTTAYAIHRRGIEHLVSNLYNKSSGKFIVSPLAKCHFITADDCLLGFSAARDFQDRSAQLRHVYKATPPLFLHDSVNSQLHLRNFCQDLELSIEDASNSSRERPTEAKAMDGVLLFFAVESSRSPGIKSAMKGTLKRANGSDIFYAFADTDPAEEASALKLQLLRRYWPMFGPTWSEKYAFVWALNEDVKLRFSPQKIVAEANKSGALAVAPAMVHTLVPRPRPHRRSKKHRRKHRKTSPLQRLLDTVRASSKHSSKFTLKSSSWKCRFRFTNYVNALAPMLTPAAWGQVFNETGPASSFEGVDQMWCDSLQRSGRWHSRKDGLTPCAVLEELVAAHLDDVEEEPSDSVRLGKGLGVGGEARYEFCVPRAV